MYEQINDNIRKTYLYIFLAFCLILGLGWFFSWFYNDTVILIWVAIFAIVYNLIAYFVSDQVVLVTNGAKEIDKEQAPELFRVVENLSIRTGMPMPRIYVIDESMPNAFACGRDPKHASLAVTVGLLKIMDKDELEGVIAHEMSHVKNYDIRLQTVVAVLVGLIVILANFMARFAFFSRDENSQGGIIGLIGLLIIVILAPIIGQLIQLAISRKRELLADASGVELTRYPNGLISALEKIDHYEKGMKSPSYATAHLYFASPMHSDASDEKNVGFIVRLFMTHPPISERIAALKKMKF
jgi:heat shock protein HtpX